MSTARFSHDEKRQFLRMFVQSDITLTDRSGEQHGGLCINLSANGLLVETASALAPGEHLEIFLPSPRPSLRDLRVRAQIIRIEPGEKHQHRLGLQIVEFLD